MQDISSCNFASISSRCKWGLGRKAWSISIAVLAKLIVSTFTMYIADIWPIAPTATAYLDNIMDYFDDAYMLIRLITVVLLIIAVCFVGARNIPSV